MFSIDEIRRNAHHRVRRFHEEANAMRYRHHRFRVFRIRTARIVHAAAAWIEPEASKPRGVPHASP